MSELPNRPGRRLVLASSGVAALAVVLLVLLLSRGLLFSRGATQSRPDSPRAPPESPPRPSSEPGAAGEPQLLFREREGRPASLAFSADGRSLVVGHLFGGVGIWDVETGAKLKEASGDRGIWEVTSLSLSPDGEWVAMGNQRGASIWVLAEDEVMKLWPDWDNPATELTFRPGGVELATARTETMYRKHPMGEIRLWDLETGERVKTFEEQKGHLTAIAFSPDRRYLAAGHSWRDRDGKERPWAKVVLWDAASGRKAREFDVENAYGWAVAFSPDGRHLACGYARPEGEDVLGGADVWDVQTGEKSRTLGFHDHGVGCVAFSPDGRLVVTGSADSTAALWSAKTGERVRTIEGHDDYVFAAAFAPDGRTLALGSRDGTVSLWDVGTGDRKGTIDSPGTEVNAIAVSPDGEYVATATGYGCSVWSARTGKVVARPLDSSGQTRFGVLFGPYGRTLLADAIWRTEVSEVGTWKFAGFLPDERHLVSSSRDGRYALLRKWLPPEEGSGSNRYRTQLILREEGVASDVMMFEQEAEAECGASLSADGRWLAAGGADGELMIWDIADGKWRAPVKGEKGPIHSAAFSPDGGLLAVSESWREDGTDRTRVVVRSMAETADAERTAAEEGALSFAAQEGWASAVRFSPDGRSLLVLRLPERHADADRAALWDVGAGELLRTLPGDMTVADARFHPDDGSVILLGPGGAVHVWRAREHPQVGLAAPPTSP